MSEPPKRRMRRPPSGGAASGRGGRTPLASAKTHTPSSQAWLQRQLADPFAAEARARGYRSRAAFKLTEIDDRFALLRRARVLDLGCAPGGWLQVAVERGASRVVGVDLLPTEALAGAEILQADFLGPDTAERLLAALGAPPTVILSDMAPNTTGHKRTDHLRIIALIEAAAAFAAANLPPGGAFLAKAFQGGETAEALAGLKRAFAEVRHVKPRASRAESAEVYLLAQDFRGRS